MTLLGSEHSMLIRSKFRSVLQLRLQQRRTREQLADQGIMPPLKSPAALHEQRKSIERSKTGDFLKHKIRGKQERSHLSNMHLIHGSHKADGSAAANQSKLKRARLADNLNQRIALRPGPLELVEKNIIPVDSSVKEAALKVNHGKLLKQEDSYAFEEDSSSESLSPEQPRSNESQSSMCSMSEPKSSDSSSPAFIGCRQGCQNGEINGQTENTASLKSQEESHPAMNNQSTPPVAVPSVAKTKPSDKSRHKKPKDTKPKVKKLKYHQYIPPDQKVEKSPPPMDTAYARLLQQQQLFLQLQILSQQKHQQQHLHQHQHPQQRQQSFSFQPLHTPPLKQSVEQLQVSSSVSNSRASSASSSPVKSTYCAQTNVSPVKPGPLPSNLDDLKVSELRQQLRLRGLPVSGTKTALIERLKPFKDPIAANSSAASSGDITTITFPVTPTGSLSSYHSPGSSCAASSGGFYPFCSTSSTPPISPASSSDLSVSGSLPDSFSDVTMSSPHFNLHTSPGAGCVDDEGPEAEKEKDKMLVEKQKVIEELTWKLHQEQRQVEELKMQLHKRKQGQAAPPRHLQPHFMGVSVKQEHAVSSCPLSALLSPQCSPQHSPISRTGTSPQHSSLPASPHSPYLLSVPGEGHSVPTLHNGMSRTHNIQMAQKPIGQSGSCSYPADQRGLQPLFSPNADNSKTKSPNVVHKMAILHSPRHTGQKCPVSSAAFCSSHSAASPLKQPPCYEDAVKQQLTRSQQMDELLDVLIESGEMPANAKEERPCSTKVVPHITVSTGSSSVPLPKFLRHYEHMSSPQLPFDPQASSGDTHLGALLNSPMGRALGATEGPLEESTEGQGLSMSFTESPWETMEWLELTPPSSATAFSAIPQTGPSIFTAEFLDVTDINLNSAMDLHLEQW